MTGTVTLLVAIAAVVGAPLIAYLTASRKLSGRIATSDAGQLWAESSKIREDYRARINEANTRQAELEARVARLEGQNNDLVRENRELRDRIDLLERENADLKRQVADLLEDLRKERKER